VLGGKMKAWENSLNQLYYLYDNIHPTSKFGHRCALAAAARRIRQGHPGCLCGDLQRRHSSARAPMQRTAQAHGPRLQGPGVRVRVCVCVFGGGVGGRQHLGPLPPLSSALGRAELPSCRVAPRCRSLGEVSYELFEKTLRDLDANPLHQVGSKAASGWPGGRAPAAPLHWRGSSHLSCRQASSPPPSPFPPPRPLPRRRGAVPIQPARSRAYPRPSTIAGGGQARQQPAPAPAHDRRQPRQPG
jgi:hypothetical protein